MSNIKVPKVNLKEATRFLREGDEALKTGLFKWSKDYGSAAFNYDQSAKLFRQAGEFNIATRLYEKLIQVNSKLNDSWSVAKNYEAIVQISVERTDGVHPSAEPLVKWTLQAGKYFRLAKSHHSYIALVKKVSQYLDDQGDLIEAMNLNKNLINDLEDDEQFYLRSEAMTTYTALLLKIRKYPECINLFEREYTLKKNQAGGVSKSNIETLALTVIILNIIIGDIDKAEKRLQDFAIEIRNFIKGPEFDVCEKMIEYYTDGKQAEFDKVANRSLMNNVFPLAIIKDLRNVKVPTDDPKRKSTVMEDTMGPTSSITRGHGQTNFFSSYQDSNNDNAPMTEEQRKRALDDFLC